MNLVPRDSWFDVEPFLNHIFNRKDNTDNKPFFSPNVDITEKEDTYEIVADLPGVKKEDLNVHLHDGLLTIEAQTNEESNSEKDKVIRRERKTGYFSRSFSVGKSVTDADINAKFNDGVLVLNFKKQEDEIDKKKKITIN